jgi:CheY-like chemotaxis protein
MGSLSNQTILVVEDYQDSREMLRLLLEGLSYRILEAKNGKDALDSALMETPDLIVTDFNLPDMDGLTLLKRLRSLGDDMSRIPVIMMTAHDPGQIYELAMAAGCAAFFTKPLSFFVLEKTVNQLLEKSNELNRSLNDNSH